MRKYFFRKIKTERVKNKNVSFAEVKKDVAKAIKAIRKKSRLLL